MNAPARSRQLDVYYVENVDPLSGGMSAIWVGEDGAVHFADEHDRYYVVASDEAVKMALVILERRAASGLGK